jgi:hypothetical protein
VKNKGHFFIIGAQRSATTYLYTILDEHPEIIMAKPVKPEPKFFLFEEEYQKGLDYYLNFYFKEAWDKKTSAQLFGEKTTSYYESETALKRIKESFPGCKIIMILRNPTTRAISNYYFSVKNGLETRSIEDVFLRKIPPEKEIKGISVSPFNYIGRSEYLKFIKTINKYFEKEQFRILIMENFLGNVSAIQELYRFLKVDDQFIPEKVNKIVNANDKPEAIIPSSIIKELSDYFYPQITVLENFLCRDLGVWKK